MPPQALSPPSAAVGAPNFHMFHPKDHGKMALVGLFMVALAHLRRKQMRKRWLNAAQQVDAEHNKQSLLRQFVDHPAGAYVLDNGAVLGLTYCILRFLPRPQQGRPVYSLLCNLLTTLCLAEPLILFEKFCATVLYPHVPYFSDNPLTVPSHDWWTMFTEFLQCNFMASLAGNAAGVVAYEMMPADQFDRIVANPKPMRFVPYVAKFFFCRVVADIMFHAAHRAMHHFPSIYNTIHKRHHEHTTPQMPTNYHFSWIDIAIEGGLPYGSAVFALQLLGYEATYVEQMAILTPQSYFESASHTGKEIPTVSWFPVLSPLVDFFTGCDQRLVEYHTRHHQLFRCNYSISPWVDKLMGTYRIDLPSGYGGGGKSLPQQQEEVKDG